MNVIKAGNRTSLTTATAINDRIPVAIYNLGYSEKTGFYLHERPDFTMPPKIYGDHDTFVDRVIKSHKVLGHGIGVLLQGPKGCGKTITAKQIATKCNMPVVCITDAFCGGSMIEFMEELPNPVMFFIDEFEKVYKEREHRDFFLSVLDGIGHSRHLFVLTSNEPNIGEFFLNRPGRIRYNRAYDQLDAAIIDEMIDDMMPKGKLRTAVKETVQEMGTISPDALVAMIHEVLVHEEPPSKFMEYFNVQDALDGYYDVELTTTGAAPKPGLSKAKREVAMEYICELTEHGIRHADRYYTEGKPLVEKNQMVFTKEYTRVFSAKLKGDAGDVLININYLSMGKVNRNLTLRRNEVKSITRKQGTIRIESIDGDVLVCHPAKPMKSGLAF